jgi:hypothetical protein
MKTTKITHLKKELIAVSKNNRKIRQINNRIIKEFQAVSMMGHDLSSHDSF